MSQQGTATLDFGTPAHPARKTYYFHSDTTLGGVPAAPAGNATLSESVPDAIDAAAASIAGGHVSTSTGAESSLLNKPAAKDVTEVPGMPPMVNMPVAAHRFGWFSDLALTGSFTAGIWRFQWREDDSSAGIGGNPIINLFASTTRDFTGTVRFLGQLIGPTDWWAGGANTNAWVTTTLPKLDLAGEYLFVQVWCHETTGLSAGQTLTFHQEGSDLTDAQRSMIQTPHFLPTGYAESTSVVITGQAGILAGSHAEAFFMSDSTGTNGVDEHQEAAVMCPLVCENVVAGVGFTITARPIGGMPIGTFNVRWVWN